MDGSPRYAVVVAAQVSGCRMMADKATDFLDRASALLTERGKQYDSDGGERSMAQTVRAFNAITGRDIREDEGWLLMLLLKQVRQYQTLGKFHRDSAEDAVSYAALHAECLAGGK